MRDPTLFFDSEVKALYVRFSDHAAARSVELSETVYIDVDDQGEPVSFEILEANGALLDLLQSVSGDAPLAELLAKASEPD